MLKLVISPGFTLPSGSSESHRSQIVVAPCATGASQDGGFTLSISACASSRWPVRVSASQRYGAPAKPALTR